MTSSTTTNYLNSHTSSRWTSGFMSWFMSTDHKRIGIMYAVAMFSFFFAAVLLGFVMKLQKMYPGSTGWEVIPPEMYGSFFTLHAIIMIFLFIVPGAPPQFWVTFFYPCRLALKMLPFPG